MNRKSIKIRNSSNDQIGQVTATDLRRMLNRLAEKKLFMNYGNNQTFTTAPNGGYPTYINLIPSIAQGTALNQRIGNEINITRMSLKIALNLLPYSATTNPNLTPIYIRILIVSCKSINTTTITNTPINSDFYMQSPTPVGFQGTCLDIVMPINKNNWTVHTDKTIRLGVSYASSTGPASTGNWFDNSAMSEIVNIDLSRYVQKLTYDSGLSNNPMNRNLFCVMQAVSCDGTYSGSLQMCEYHYTFEVDFTDV